MKYAKIPVYKFSELPERVQQRLIEDERQFYFDEMWLDYMMDYLIERPETLHDRGFTIGGREDVSIDVSCDRYDHFTILDAELDKDIILDKSGARALLEEAADGSFTAAIMDVDLEPFIDNLCLSHHCESRRDYWCDSGEITVELLDDNDGMYDNDTIDSLLDAVSQLCTEYLHKIQYEVYTELRDATEADTTDEALIQGMDDSLHYTAEGIIVADEDIE